MAREFAGVQRGQLLLMPPALSEWLPEDHLVWTVLGAVDQMDLDRFREAYRVGGAGRAPFDPAVMVALLLYAYARGIRSSRAIERACWEDVAFKVIMGMRTPDHSTVAEFRRRHESEIAELFDEVLGLCREAGLVSVGVIAIDGTKIKASASMDQTATTASWSDRSCARPRTPIARRTSSMGLIAGMSCPRRCAPQTAAAKRWPRPSSGWPTASAARSSRSRSRS
jgi:transposase